MGEVFLTTLAAGGGIDWLSLVGVAAFLILSFLSKKAQKAAKEGQEDEVGTEHQSASEGGDASYLPTTLSPTAHTQTPESLQTFGKDLPTEKKSAVDSFEQELRRLFGEEPEEVPPPPVSISPNQASSPDSSVLATPVRRKEIEVLKVAKAARGKEVKEAASQIKAEARSVQKNSDHATSYAAIRRAGSSLGAPKVKASDTPGARLGGKLRSVENLRDYIVVASILGKPKGLCSQEDEIDRVI